MARPIQPNTPQSRARAQAWLRQTTRVAVLAATGLAALIGVVVAREHPGSSSAATGTRTTGSGTSGASTGGTNGTSSNSDDSGTSNTGSTGNTGNTGTSGSSNSPSISNSTPAVTSGGSSR